MVQKLLFNLAEFNAFECNNLSDTRSGCFVDNMKLPVHRWFRYSAGFSAEWVRTLLRERKISGTKKIILDPFAGIATTLVACNTENVKSFGFESHPFVFKLANAKLSAYSHSAAELTKIFSDFEKQLDKYHGAIPTTFPTLMQKCYCEKHLLELYKMKSLLENSPWAHDASLMIWFAITAILRSCSHVGTAQWQYVLPNKTKSRVLTPISAFQEKSAQIIEDTDSLHGANTTNRAVISLTDARGSSALADNSIDFVITSPPYPNNYDYADATRLEMTFWGEIQGWSDLHSAVRTHLLCSCTQHATAERIQLEELLNEPLLSPIYPEIYDACTKLSEIRLQKGGKKSYHIMIASYFKDLALVFRHLRRVCRKDAEMCFVIGDSAPYGIYIPVERWLGELAISAGFISYRFEKIRDRNIKWKNRKHDVPLKEGRLWIQG